MTFSDERLAYLVKQLASEMRSRQFSDAPETTLTAELRKAFIAYDRRREKIDTKVREKIGTLKRGVAEGSREWGILYRQYFDEEMAKLG